MEIYIIYDEELVDPTINFISSNKLFDNIHAVTVSQLIKDFGYHFDNNTGVFTNDNRKIPYKRNVCFINRAIEISHKTMTNLKYDGCQPCRGHINNVLENILCDYSTLIDRNNIQYSTVGILIPLFTQWQIIKLSINNIHFPEFKHASGFESIDFSEFTRAVHKEPHELYNWKPNKKPDEIKYNQFVVNRPSGNPFISFFCGTHANVNSIGVTQKLTHELKDRILTYTKLISKIFNCVIGECLWFIDGQKITFASFSHYYTSINHFPKAAKCFENMVDDLNENTLNLKTVT